LNAHYIRHTPEGQPRKLGVWSEEETQALIETISKGIQTESDYILLNGTIKLYFLSLNILRRVGFQCKN